MLPSPSVGRCLAVLVVDDNEMMRSFLTRILQPEGWRVYTAVDGIDALALLETGIPVDVVVSDVMMPRMNGHQLAAELTRRFPRLPLLLISGAHLAGVTTCQTQLLPKPFTPMALMSSIREVLGDSRQSAVASR
jgi:CheY-like chemotaxis protein